MTENDLKQLKALGEVAQAGIKVGDVVTYRGFDTGNQDYHATVECISALNGREFAHIRIGQKLLKIYTSDLVVVKSAPADPAAQIAELTAEVARLRDALSKIERRDYSMFDSTVELVRMMRQTAREALKAGTP